MMRSTTTVYLNIKGIPSIPLSVLRVIDGGNNMLCLVGRVYRYNDDARWFPVGLRTLDSLSGVRNDLPASFDHLN